MSDERVSRRMGLSNSPAPSLRQVVVMGGSLHDRLESTVTKLTTSGPTCCSVKVNVGAVSATLMRSQLLTALEFVTDPGTCDETTTIRGLRLGADDIRSLLDDIRRTR